METLDAFGKHRVVHVVERWTGSHWEPVHRLAQVQSRLGAEEVRLVFLDDRRQQNFWYPENVRAEGFE